VSIDAVRRSVDDLLLNRLRLATAELGRLDSLDGNLKNLELAFNEPGDAGLAKATSDLFSAFEDLSNNSDSSALRSTAAQSVQTWTANLRDLADRLQTLRDDYRGALESEVDAINDLTAEIGTLKEQLASTNSSLATLIEMYRDKSQLSDMQRTELNTAYYIVGTSRELRDSGVLSKEGGVVGIGGVNKLNTSALPVDKFTRIDVVRTQEITLGAKKAKLATAHPEGSYRLDGGNKLTILDANVFWSISKYLVVEVE
jgi:flagellar hook-associated protein FlgK